MALSLPRRVGRIEGSFDLCHPGTNAPGRLVFLELGDGVLYPFGQPGLRLRAASRQVLRRERC